MHNKKFSKRAALTSIIVVILCCALLIGNTFAWFTDSHSSGINTIHSGELDLEVSTGDVTLTDTIASGNLRAETTTGDVTLTRADAAALNLKTTSGAVTGTLRTPKIFYTDTTSGSVDVPRSTEGGICEIKTTSGSIRMTIAE